MSCYIWKCKNIDENKECEAIESECIGDLCDLENDCNYCRYKDSRECPE